MKLTKKKAEARSVFKALKIVPDGDLWKLTTIFLGNEIGGYYGKSTGLTLKEAEELKSKIEARKDAL